MYILGIDTETTGLGSGAKIIELAAILVDAKTFKTVDSLNQRINPLIPISESATRMVLPMTMSKMNQPLKKYLRHLRF